MRSQTPLKRSRITAYLQLVLWSRIAAFVAAIVIAFTFTAWHYRAHLLWKIYTSREAFNEFRPVPDFPMPQTDVPSEWPQYVVGGMKFCLPPELIVHQEILDDDRISTLDFDGGNYAILVSTAPDWNEVDESLSLETRLSPKQEVFTMPRLVLEFYRTGSNDFRWTMSRREVQWHSYCSTMASLVRISTISRIETLFSRNYDAIVLFGDEIALIQCQCKGAPYGVQMAFHFRDIDVNPHLVRQVCQSLEPAH